VAGVCLGMSGVDRPNDKLKVVSWVNELLPTLKHSYKSGEETDSQLSDSSILVYNDAVAALASGTKGQLYGAVVISGTGTIVVGYARDQVTNTRSGGWG
jgi:N-acetylglucosamine kinase-like BadF-type ATPase